MKIHFDRWITPEEGMNLCLKMIVLLHVSSYGSTLEGKVLTFKT